ncbi:MAG: inositol monophosphatase family protein [Bacillota bacterium]|nr:inositol monophosphatase family protein [Bacillota bacterium]
MTPDTNTELKQELTTLIEIVETTAAWLPGVSAPHQGLHEKSGVADFVTSHDLEMQRQLEAALSAAFPAASFLGEEGVKNAPAAIRQAMDGTAGLFIVDPIDGTSNFVYGYKHSSVSVALIRGGEPVLAVVYNPWLSETFAAARGQGSFCRDRVGTRPCRPSSVPLDRAIILYGSTPYYRDLIVPGYRLLQTLHLQGRDMRRSGSAALDLCYIASGRGDLFFELRLQAWDYAAGLLICREAGAVVTDAFGGSPVLPHASSIIAGNPLVQPAAIKVIRELGIDEAVRISEQSSR